jgi:hypothetical protein
MALPDYVEVTQGTPIVFGEPSAAGVTHSLSLDGMVSGAARMSSAADLGADFSEEYVVFFRIETGATAPTAGNTYDLYLISSHDNTNWPAKVTGSEGSYTLGTSDANLRQAGSPVCVLIATADPNAILEQAPVIWRPRGRYVVAIVDNNSGQPIKDEPTNTDNGSRVILVPRRIKLNE